MGSIIGAFMGYSFGISGNKASAVSYGTALFFKGGRWKGRHESKWWAASCGAAARFSRHSAPEGHPQAGFWEFPGGKVEPGESLEAALARELAEELSLSIRNPKLWRTVEHDYDFRSVRLHFFHITEFSGEPAANDGQAFRWVTPEEAQTLPFLEADRPLLFDLIRP